MHAQDTCIVNQKIWRKERNTKSVNRVCNLTVAKNKYTPIGVCAPGKLLQISVVKVEARECD